MIRLVAFMTIFILIISGAAFAEDGFRISLGYSVGNSAVTDNIYYLRVNEINKDKYDGLIHGPHVSVQYERHRLFLRGTFDYNWYESSNYYPFFDSLSGYSTKAKVRTYKFEGNIGYKIFHQNEISLTPYLGLGYLNEKLELEYFNGVTKSSWPYGVAGAIISYATPQWAIGLDIAALMPFCVRTEIAPIQGTLFETSIGIGARVQIPLTYNIIMKKDNAFGLMLFASPFYEYSETGKSSAIDLQSPRAGYSSVKLGTSREQYGVRTGITFLF
jgi:hypothetical protein